MCDYSLEFMKTDGKTVEAKIGDVLVTTAFSGTPTRGFSPVFHVGIVACCLLPGTELVFEEPIRVHASEADLRNIRTYNETMGIFRKINPNEKYRHHDGIELPSGHMLTLSRLAQGQRARVLQVPAPQLKVPAEEERKISFCVDIPDNMFERVRREMEDIHS